MNNRFKINSALTKIKNILNPENDLHDKFSEAEFKLETINLLNRISLSQVEEVVAAPVKKDFESYIKEQYQNVVHTEVVTRLASRPIENIILPTRPAEGDSENEIPFTQLGSVYEN